MGIFGAKERFHEGGGRCAFRPNKSCENRARFFFYEEILYGQAVDKRCCRKSRGFLFLP